MVFIETLIRAPSVSLLIFPTFQELLRLVPQVFENSTTPSLYMLQGGLHPENTARPCCPSRALPVLQFQQDRGEGKSPGPQATSRKISRFQDFIFLLLYSWLQQTLLSLAEVLKVLKGLKGFPQEGRREQPQLAPFCCSLCKRGHVRGGGRPLTAEDGVQLTPPNRVAGWSSNCTAIGLK